MLLFLKYMEGSVHDGLHGDWGAKCALRHVALVLKVKVIPMMANMGKGGSQGCVIVWPYLLFVTSITSYGACVKQISHVQT